MDAFARSVRFGVSLLLLSLSILIAMPGGDCIAGYPCHYYLGNHYPYFDGSVRAAWSRTWHAPTPWSTPLTPYYVPRMSANGYGGECTACANGSGTVNCGCYSGEFGRDMGANGEFCGVEGGFERIGHIPNELGIGGSLPPGAPPTPPQ